MTPKRSIIPVFVPHLGCPQDCVFCNQRRISGSPEPATAEKTVEIIEEALSFLPKNTEKTVAFYGGSFTAIDPGLQEELLGSVQPYIKAGRIKDIRLSTRPDAVDEEVIARLKRFNVRTVEIGVQSMDEEVLQLSKRGHTAQDAERAARLIKAAGFELILQMMTGLPGDTPEKSIETARKFCSLNPDGVRIYPTVVIKDTELCDQWRSGEYREHSVQDAIELGADLLDIFENAGITVVRFGLNPTEDLSGGDAVGGAYHPALRELCESVRYLRAERRLLTEADRGKTVRFLVPKGRVSQAVGQKRANAEALISEFGIKNAVFVECDEINNPCNIRREYV